MSFSAWLAHEAGQAESRALASRWREGWQASAAARAIDQSLDAALAADDDKAAGMRLAALLDDASWLADWTSRLVACLGGDSFADPAVPSCRTPFGTGATIAERGAGAARAVLRIHWIFAPPPQPVARFAPGAVATRLLRGEARFLRLSADGAAVEPVTRRAGEPARAFDGAVEALLPLSIDAPLLTVEATTARPGEVGWAMPGQPPLARWQGEARDRRATILPLLRTLAPDRLAGALRPLLDDPESAVRWMALREWLAADPAAALPTLERFADADPDPRLRGMAATVRDRFAMSKAA